MPKNIVFDLGGVVVHFDARNWLVDRFFNEKTENAVYRLTFGSEAWQQWDRGEIGVNTLRQRVMEQAAKEHLTFEVGVTLEDWATMLTDKKGTIDVMRQLKESGYTLYYLSNTEPETLEMLRRREFWQLWDGGVGSCEIGYCKPDPKIFEFMTARYGLEPSDTIFIDDNLTNIQAAQQLGYSTIHYQSYRSLVSSLRALGVFVQAYNFLHIPVGKKKELEDQ